MASCHRWAARDLKATFLRCSYTPMINSLLGSSGFDCMPRLQDANRASPPSVEHVIRARQFRVGASDQMLYFIV
jgi:hypothetical protein